MPRLHLATFNIPCSGAGTFVLLGLVQSDDMIYRQIYGIDVDSAGNQAKYTGASDYSDISITINNGIATVNVYTNRPVIVTVHFRCCFIPGAPFA